MPFQKNIRAYTLNRQRHVLGRQKSIDISLAQSDNSTTTTNNVYELIVKFTAGETITAYKPVSILTDTVYMASNLKSDGKPCNGIALNTVTAGGSVLVQIGGLCVGLFTFTANKDVFLRDTGFSHVPLLSPDASEDGYQRIGTAINTNSILINIEPFYEL